MAHVEQARRPARLVRAATVSVVSNSALTLAKLFVGISTGTLSVLSEALHSASDLLAAIIALSAVKTASAPADTDHPFGHGKYESLSAMAEGGLLLAAAVWICLEAVARLTEGGPAELLPMPGMVVMAAAAVVNAGLSTYLFAVSRQYDSPALHADAVHLRADVWTSAGVFAGLGAIMLGAPQWIDSLLALAVALVVTVEGLLVLFRALGELADTALPANERAIIQQVLFRHPGPIITFHRLRTRKHGRGRQADVHIVVCHRISLRQVHDLTEQLQAMVARMLPGTDLVVHAEPCENTQCDAPPPTGFAQGGIGP